MNEHLRERTKLGKVWEIHEILPYVGDYCADWGRYNEVNCFGEPDVDWFPAPGQWTMVYDWLGDFSTLPLELQQLSHSELTNLYEALAKDYVGYNPKNDEPDPDFWAKIKTRWPMCHVNLT